MGRWSAPSRPFWLRRAITSRCEPTRASLCGSRRLTRPVTNPSTTEDDIARVSPRALGSVSRMDRPHLRGPSLEVLACTRSIFREYDIRGLRRAGTSTRSSPPPRPRLRKLAAGGGKRFERRRAAGSLRSVRSGAVTEAPLAGSTCLTSACSDAAPLLLPLSTDWMADPVTGSHNPSDKRLKVCLGKESRPGEHIHTCDAASVGASTRPGRSEPSDPPRTRRTSDRMDGRRPDRRRGVRRATARPARSRPTHLASARRSGLFCAPDGLFSHHHPDPTVP